MEISVPSLFINYLRIIPAIEMPLCDLALKVFVVLLPLLGEGDVGREVFHDVVVCER